MKVIDTHAHLWNLDELRLPWLDSEDYLKQNFNATDYKKSIESRDTKIEKAIYMEVDVAPKSLKDENQFALDLVKSSKNIFAGACISGDLSQKNFSLYIDEYANCSEIKGVRQVLHIAERERGYCLQADFIDNVKYLGEKGLVFEACLRFEEQGDLYELASQTPDTIIVLDHLGMPNTELWLKNNPSEEDKKAMNTWRESLKKLASLPNVVCKVSGIPLGENKNEPALAKLVTDTLLLFGEDRIMFASNYPVCNLTTSVNEWIQYLIDITNEFGTGYLEKLFYKNANRIYKI